MSYLFRKPDRKAAGSEHAVTQLKHLHKNPFLGFKNIYSMFAALSKAEIQIKAAPLNLVHVKPPTPLSIPHNRLKYQEYITPSNVASRVFCNHHKGLGNNRLATAVSKFIFTVSTCID